MRECFIENCNGLALPYSAFCGDHYDESQFNEIEKKAQNDFIKKNVKAVSCKTVSIEEIYREQCDPKPKIVLLPESACSGDYPFSFSRKKQ
jgi:hypothetical protein